MPLKDLSTINELLGVLSAKWTTEVLRELSDGPVRTSVFLHHIPGLTMKCLRQRLVELEHEGYINRKEYAQRPLKVEYSLTPRGAKLLMLLNQIKSVADELAATASCSCTLEQAAAN